MNELQFGNKARHLLNQRLALKPETEKRLRAAREAALARQREAPARAFVASGSVLARLGWTGGALAVVVPVLMLAAGGFALHKWQVNERVAEIEEIDTQLLTDDLPIDAYLDRGFQNWLASKRAPEK